MKESDLALSRRRFLLASAGIAASVIVAPSLLDALDRLGPRRLLVPPPPKIVLPYDGSNVIVLDQWEESRFPLTDEDLVAMLSEQQMNMEFHRRAFARSSWTASSYRITRTA